MLATLLMKQMLVELLFTFGLMYVAMLSVFCCNMSNGTVDGDGAATGI